MSVRSGTLPRLSALALVCALLLTLAGMTAPTAFGDSAHTWYLRNSNSAGGANLSFGYGRAGGSPIAGDWNGNGRVTAGWFEDGRVYLRDSNSSGSPNVVFNYGRRGDVPVVGDWNGNGVDTIGVRRGDTWYLSNRNAAGAPAASFNYGRVGDVPVMGDWNRNGTTTVGVVRPPSPPNPAPQPKPDPKPAPKPDPEPEPEPEPDPEPGDPTPDAVVRPIAFTHEPTSGCNGPCGERTTIWTTDADGNAGAVTAPNAAYDRFARWAPDGHALAFTRTDPASGAGEVWVMEVSEPGFDPARRVSQTGGAHGGKGCAGSTLIPNWSPNARRLAFTCAFRDSASTVYVVGSDGKNQFAVPTPSGFADAQPTWSPASDRLAFARRDLGKPFGTSSRIQLWTARAGANAASDLKALVANAGAASQPRWAPAGDRILYVSADEVTLRSALHTVPAGGGSPTALWTAPAGQVVTLYDAAWSPDAKRVAFPVGDGFRSSVIHTVDVPSGNARAVTDANTLAFTPTWSPQGNAVLFDRIRPTDVGDVHELAVTAPTQVAAKPITISGGYGSDANWRP